MQNKKTDTDPQIVLPSYYLQQIINQAKNMGANHRQLLQSLDFNESNLEQYSITLDWQKFYRFILIAKKNTSPNLGLLVGRRLLINTHGSLGDAVLNSGSIRQFVEVLTSFLPLRTNLIVAHHCIKHDGLQMQLQATRNLGEIEHLILEAVMAAIKNVFDYITMGGTQLAQVSFSFAKKDTEHLAQSIFACELNYQQSWTGFTFPLSVIDNPLLIADKEAFEKAAAHCRQQLKELDSNMPLSKKIEYFMLKKQGDFPTVEEITQVFNLSERTMYRLLKQENIRFTDITDKVKYSIATKHLNSGLINMQEVGILLGYQHIKNFRVAFKRWEKKAQSWGSSK